MAALGKIRSKGVLLICIISLGLFAFIAEEAFRSCESSSAEKHQQVGEVLGDKISVTEFQKLVDEYTEVIKMQQGQDNLNEDQLNQVKDMVWNTYVQTKLIANETEKLGLTVTDQEMQDVLTQGTNPMLMQTPFFNHTRHRAALIPSLQSSMIQSTSTGTSSRRLFVSSCSLRNIRVCSLIASFLIR